MAHEQRTVSESQPKDSKSLPLRRLLLPICWVIDHDTYIDGTYFKIDCRRCGRSIVVSYWWQRIPHKTSKTLVRLANWIIGENEANGWFHGYGQISNIDYIAKSHLQGLVKQGDDMLLSDYLSDKGWIKLSDLKHEDGTAYTGKEQADLITKSLTLEATRQEQEELNRHD